MGQLRAGIGILARATLGAIALGVFLSTFSSIAQATPSHPRREALDVTGLDHACGAAVDSQGDLYLSSAGESKIKVYDPEHNLLTQVEDANAPCALALTTTGVLYVSEQATGEVVRFKPSAYPFAGTPTYGEREVIDASGKARGIAVDPFDNRLYVAEGERVSVYGSGGSLGINEVQRVFLSETSGGTFKLKFEGKETASIKFDASAAEVKAALEALSTIGESNVGVTSPKAEEFLLTFTGALGHKDVPLLEGDASGLTGGAPKILFTEAIKGWSGHVGEGILTEASAVAPYGAEGESFKTDRHLAVADSAGLEADRLYLFGGTDIRSLALRRELTGASTPDGSFEFGAQGAALAADPGNVKAKKCATVGAQACTAGHLFLYDAGHEALDELDGSGEYLDRTVNAAFADAEPTAITIDRSGKEDDGTLYVTAGAGEGAKALAFGPLAQPGRKALAKPISKVLASARAVATDSYGDVYAGSGAHVHVYEPGGEGKELTSFEDTGGPRDLAVDSHCNVYVLDGETTVTYYKPSACPPTSTTTYSRHEPAVAKSSEFPEGSNSLQGVAVNPGPSEGKDRLFVSSNGVIREYDSAANGSEPLKSAFASGLLPGTSTPRSIAVNGANGNVYIGANPHLIYVINPAGTEVLARIDTAVSVPGTPAVNPYLAVDQANGHVVEFDGSNKSAREYEPVTGAFVAEFGSFTEGLVRFQQVAVDNSCAIRGLSGKECEEFDPADRNVYVAFDDTAAETYDVTAFGPLRYPEPEKHKLAVEKTGSGTGTVTSEPPGIDCGSECEAEYEETKVVKLNAEADEVSESKFEGWSGCEKEEVLSPTEGVCWVTMNKDRAVTAEFGSENIEKLLEVLIEGTGSGKVTSNPTRIECTYPPLAGTCSALFPENGTVTLTATADKGSEVVKWTGCDAEPSPAKCEVEMSEDKVVRVELGPERPLLAVVKEGNGTGTVTSAPAGIDCGSTCTHKFNLNEPIVLEAEADPGSKFLEWGGACSGSGACEVEMDEAKEVKAAFVLLPVAKALQPHPISYTEATLRGEVDTAERETEYRFEYLSEAEYEANGESFEGARKTEGTLAPAKAPVAVKAPLLGLKEGTAYRLRLLVANTAGTDADEGGFVTLQRAAPQSCANAPYRTGLSAALPDCRAYELATPAQTNGLVPYATDDGGSASGSFSNWFTPQHDEAAGERLSYFTDGTLPGFEGNGHRDGYRAERGAGDHPAEGWQSALISPDYAQSGGSQPQQHGISADQLFSIWETTITIEAFPETLPPREVYLRTPEGFEALGRGSLGTDSKALSRYVGPGGVHVIFSSKAHLEPQTSLEGHAALYDRAAGAGATTTVVSSPPAGASAALKAEFETQDASYLGANEDGSAVAFSVGGKLYMHYEGATFAITESSSAYAGISEDGRYVFFAYGDGISPGRLFRYDMQTEEASEIADSGIFALVSPDGSHAYFSSEEVLSEEASENCRPECEKAQAGAHNLYVWDGEKTSFIARLTGADFEHKAFADVAGMNLAAWTQALGIDEQSGRAFAPTRSTPGGNVLVFQSHARLSAYDNEGRGEIYRYDLGAAAGERLLCVSCDPAGTPPTADALLEDSRTQIAGVPVKPKTMIANLTDGGQKVFFQSFDRLLPADVNEAEDVYEWEAQGTGGCTRPGGCLTLVSSGQGEANSYLYAMSADGRDVFFETKEKLVGMDIAGSPSIYDAREEGGIPEAVEPTPCEGDACQGPGSEPPALPTQRVAGESPQVTVPCPKGKHRVKGRCVRKHHRKRHRHHRKRHRAQAKRGGQP